MSLINLKTLRRWFPWGLLILGFLVTTAVYWPGLSGSFFFDDNPNIVDNKDVQPADASFASLLNAALSSPASEFKRPLSSLTFATNYLLTGLDPYWMKLTNLVIHLLNGLLVYILALSLLSLVKPDASKDRDRWIATLIAAGWMLLPINLTGVLYTVQRMESMANLFVLLGLIGYVAGRQRMLAVANTTTTQQSGPATSGRSGFLLCIFSITVPTAIGILAKETAAMLPLYALLIEWAVLGFRSGATQKTDTPIARRKVDIRVVVLFLLVLVLPLIAGLAWLLPGVLNPVVWSTRDFTLRTRLLSEARIVVDYIGWTLLPTPHALSFYNDDFQISSGLFNPWTTFISIVALIALIDCTWWLRPRRPLVALGIALFLGCHLLTGTILPLELIYEHRNYFASFGLMLALIPLLLPQVSSTATVVQPNFALVRGTLLVGLLLLWGSETAMTAIAWGNPLELAETLAARAPNSPRAQYELGRTYIIYSRYDPSSPFTRLAYAPLERAAALPNSSILPEQALIFMNARMHLPVKPAWWHSLIDKLQKHKPTVQDESSLGALTQCARDGQCELSQKYMLQAYLAAVSHPDPSARLLAMYGDYAWNILDDRSLGLRMTASAIKAAPSEPAYRITLIRMLVALGQKSDAQTAMKQLESLNYGGRLDSALAELRAMPGMQ
ncbi:tetratricopeptide repeat protein [Dyella nitratireducens]|uniref:Tetratricopeptide repeat protein n=1 Tax=Dyella nitratireducens TaxID=1849580 RepID=A0ABQ1FYL4_9GAMM|nr:hypothetical protein [Dyella nitratireducens]GGA33409.1 hypothetical protein GCM10010981_22910 [Dyella nitratireducens]GLQ40725.1 hypothetical protein GCM10007902_05750 [Dyella nitratireducens]